MTSPGITLLFRAEDNFIHDLEEVELSFVPCSRLFWCFFSSFAKVSAVFRASLSAAAVSTKKVPLSSSSLRF